VFTPKGDLYRLPAKATVLDFAYYIHTEVGNHCVGAKIDGKNVPIRHLLESGKKVEILTSSTQMPKMEWVNTVVSSHAKSKIRTSVRDIQSREASLGREVLERKLKNRKIEWDEGVVNQLIKKSGFKESFDFYKKLYEETIDMNSLIELYQDLYKRETGMAERVPARSAEEYNFDLEKDKQSIAIHGGTDVLVIDRNLKGIDFQMAKCCNPVYGDDVFGFVTVNGGIKIHRVNCPNAPALHERFGYRIVPAKWAGKGVSKYAITLHIVGNDDLGIVNNITSIISKESNIMLRSISIDSHDGLFSGVLTVLIDDTNVLNLLIKKLKTVKGVKAVSRT
jgi:GTP pyrophosphokinase